MFVTWSLTMSDLRHITAGMTPSQGSSSRYPYHQKYTIPNSIPRCKKKKKGTILWTALDVCPSAGESRGLKCTTSSFAYHPPLVGMEHNSYLSSVLEGVLLLYCFRTDYNTCRRVCCPPSVPEELLPRFLRYCRKTRAVVFSDSLDRFGTVVLVLVKTFCYRV